MVMVADSGALDGLDTTTSFGTLRPGFCQRLVWQLADWSALPAGWRRRLRKRFARPVKGPFDCTHQGMKFRLYPAENHCDRILFGRDMLPEKAEHEALIPYLKPGMVFVDIGANVGSYSLFVGHHCRGNARLLALEPHPRTHAKLLYNLSANGLSTEDVVRTGVGEREEVLELWSDGGSNIGHTSLLPEGTANPKVSVSVLVSPLLDILTDRKIDRIDVLKIDIEGFEDRALGPFMEHAKDALLPSQILIEVAHDHLWERDLMGLLQGRGYEEVMRTDENRLLSRVPLR